MKNIVEIEVGKIFPHPKNPRKDLGDLTELTDSIKENGIMQNLTVVPKDGDTYTAVIGHRRFAAAKLAGLKVVPCVISDMDEKKQLSTMLLENMQRSDLSLMEQAEGFQMMMDLGDTLSDIAKQTGFSESTVRRRVKLLELDKKKFIKAQERGGTLNDYIELEKIKDPERKNRVLDSVGTSNFDYQLKNALREEKWNEDKVDILKKLSSFAVSTTVTNHLRYVTCFGEYYNNKVEVPKDTDKTKYFYLDSGSYIYLYKEIPKEENAAAEKFKEEQRKKDEELKQKKAALVSATVTAHQLRREFILNFKNEDKHKDGICAFAIGTLCCLLDSYGKLDDICTLFNIDEELNYSEIAEELTQKNLKRLPWILLVLSYIMMEVDEGYGYGNYYGEFGENEELDELYKLMTAVGYEMSDEEKALQNGTSELFVAEE